MTWQLLLNLPNQRIVSRFKTEYWVIRNGQVYHQNRLIRQADSDSLMVWLDNDPDFVSLIAKDKNHVYFAWKKTKIDPHTFRSYHCWWLDKQGVYTEGENNLYPIKGADSATFQHIGDSYAIDKNHAYSYNTIIKSCKNPQKLRMLTPLSYYATDEDHVYWGGKLLKGAKPQSWRQLKFKDNDASYSTDGEGIYWCDNKLGFAKFDDWEYLVDGYSKTKKAVYHLAWVIKGENPQDWDENKAIEYAKEKQRLSDESHQAMMKKLGYL
ncbi:MULTISPECIES: DKNYY domain-containing protein [unclassified Moraxella]|uniref:DKNYY domain-containing protein n=1 Tax=unclassified Moraxella TaxID=2685852 RepID=UPI003AF9F46D